MYNILSLSLGLLAWGLGFDAIRQRSPRVFAGMCACCLSLFFQLAEVLVQVRERDWSTLLDTWDTVVFAAAVLVGVTILLNSIALLRYKKN